MTATETLDRAADEHRKAVGECVATIRALGAAQWTVARAEGKWTPAQIAEHLRLAYEPLLLEVGGGSGMAVRLPWWKWRLVRWKFLPLILRGGFPKGAPAPREFRPTSHSSTPAEAAHRLSRSAEEFLGRLAEAAERRTVRMTHPYFGKLTALETLTLLTTHARHHRKQFPGAEAVHNSPSPSKG